MNRWKNAKSLNLADELRRSFQTPLIPVLHLLPFALIRLIPPPFGGSNSGFLDTPEQEEETVNHLPVSLRENLDSFSWIPFTSSLEK
ncbi:hypothetical protein JTE90_021230 [Oedothorax gibbosus]|uniref:Uncharacterized protein n=1 Tax=Oedothorax gibbosus TaxID=931172 RepID=A0AAV6UVS4_9ARAC|nr:hypothetical protein JTE90_021230 [Oedothorax gibbosus]